MQDKKGAVQELRLDDLELDDRLQPREGINDAWVGQLAELLIDGLSFRDPLRVWEVEEGGESRRVVAGGWHRYKAGVQAGVETLPALLKSGSFAEARLDSLGDNAGHGDKLKPSERRAAVRTILTSPDLLALIPTSRAGQQNRAIAKHIGCSHTLVNTVATELAAELAAGEDNGNSFQSAEEVVGWPAGMRSERQRAEHVRNFDTVAAVEAAARCTSSDGIGRMLGAQRTCLEEIAALSDVDGFLKLLRRRYGMWHALSGEPGQLAALALRLVQLPRVPAAAEDLSLPTSEAVAAITGLDGLLPLAAGVRSAPLARAILQQLWWVLHLETCSNQWELNRLTELEPPPAIVAIIQRKELENAQKAAAVESRQEADKALRAMAPQQLQAHLQAQGRTELLRLLSIFNTPWPDAGPSQRGQLYDALRARGIALVSCPAPRCAGWGAVVGKSCPRCGCTAAKVEEQVRQRAEQRRRELAEVSAEEVGEVAAAVAWELDESAAVAAIISATDVDLLGEAWQIEKNRLNRPAVYGAIARRLRHLEEPSAAPSQWEAASATGNADELLVLEAIRALRGVVGAAALARVVATVQTAARVAALQVGDRLRVVERHPCGYLTLKTGDVLVVTQVNEARDDVQMGVVGAKGSPLKASLCEYSHRALMDLLERSLVPVTDCAGRAS